MTLGDFTTPAMAVGMEDEMYDLEWLVRLADVAVDYPVRETADDEDDDHLANRLQKYDGIMHTTTYYAHYHDAGWEEADQTILQLHLGARPVGVEAGGLGDSGNPWVY